DLGASPGDIASGGVKARLLELVRGLRARVGIAAGLSGIGVSRADLSRLAGFASMDACLATNPVSLSADDIERIYERAL
ncbi:MAG TPA: iron-containing alcohol dehydrogenase, partial [Spirochaetales bacterium]|nr:iron-containing alcohol dehydrogenase [Spirochaetales bacterium]